MKKKPPLILGILLCVLGIVLSFSGLRLLSMGGAGTYFVVVGVCVAASGVFLALGKLVGVYLYAVALALVVIWSVVEVGFDIPSLLPRITLPVLLGIYIFSRRVRDRLV